jgi:RNA polymerase sigma factor (sigma-70 family)
MDPTNGMAGRFEESRPHLLAVAARILGSTAEAEDAVQETWLRLALSDPSTIENLGGWLTTVVSRICLDRLRARSARGEEPADPLSRDLQTAVADGGGPDPEHEAVLADAVGLALMVVLDTLAPAERLAFVLHDLFGVPFADIAPVVDRSTEATRQLASRARRRVQGAGAPDADAFRRRKVVEAFMTASREGDFDALLSLLHPEAALRSDGAAVAMGSPAEVLGGRAVAEFFNGKAKAARLVYVDGLPGAMWAMGGKPKVVFAFTEADGLVTAIDLVADPEVLAAMELEPMGRSAY